MIINHVLKYFNNNGLSCHIIIHKVSIKYILYKITINVIETAKNDGKTYNTSKTEEVTKPTKQTVYVHRLL